MSKETVLKVCFAKPLRCLFIRDSLISVSKKGLKSDDAVETEGK